METGSMEGIVPAPLPLDILYEDEDILVLNKPADMPVHPSIGNYTNTLANAAAFYFQQKNELCPFRCINRLDRDTSGALILAKNALSAAILSAQMRNREIRRTYLAVVCGVTPPSGTVSAPIGRVSDSVIQRQVDPEHGESAVTHYERLAVRMIIPSWRSIWKQDAPTRSGCIWDTSDIHSRQIISTIRSMTISKDSLCILSSLISGIR